MLSINALNVTSGIGSFAEGVESPNASSYNSGCDSLKPAGWRGRLGRRTRGADAPLIFFLSKFLMVLQKFVRAVGVMACAFSKPSVTTRIIKAQVASRILVRLSAAEADEKGQHFIGIPRLRQPLPHGIWYVAHPCLELLRFALPEANRALGGSRRHHAFGRAFRNCMSVSGQKPAASYGAYNFSELGALPSSSL